MNKFKLLEKRNAAGMTIKKYCLVQPPKLFEYEFFVTTYDDGDIVPGIDKTIDVKPIGDPMLQPGIRVTKTYAEFSFKNVIVSDKNYDIFLKHMNHAHQVIHDVQSNWDEL